MLPGGEIYGKTLYVRTAAHMSYIMLHRALLVVSLYYMIWIVILIILIVIIQYLY